jgi:hypothetical protein
MAHFWMQAASGWEAKKLDLVQYDLTSVSAPQSGDRGPAATQVRAALLIRAGTAGSQVWAVAVPSHDHVRVNGRAVLAGLCVLGDRDEIRTSSGARYFFSSESLAEVETFPAQDRTVFCGRCRQKIEPGSPAVRCPGCGVWYNQSAELPCWTYADKCAFCGQQTALDAGFNWTPED